MNPTIGRIVHYFPTQAEQEALRLIGNNAASVMPAVVVAVWSPSTVNLKVIVDGKNPDLWKTSVSKCTGATIEDKSGKWDWPAREPVTPAVEDLREGLEKDTTI